MHPAGIGCQCDAQILDCKHGDILRTGRRAHGAVIRKDDEQRAQAASKSEPTGINTRDLQVENSAIPRANSSELGIQSAWLKVFITKDMQGSFICRTANVHRYPWR